MGCLPTRERMLIQKAPKSADVACNMGALAPRGHRIGEHPIVIELGLAHPPRNMLRKIGLRCCCLLLALTSVILIAKLGAQAAVGYGGSTPDLSASIAGILSTAALSIWMSKRAGPWRI
jgi:hypothetical protein